MTDPRSQDGPDLLSSDGAISDRTFSDEDLVCLFNGLKAYASVLLAVSGGSDSVALMELVRRWVDLVSEPPTVIVATIDHDLRNGSAEETQWVAARASALGFAHASKRWVGNKPTSGIQAAARSARYGLLLEIIAEHSMQAPVAIVTAHTKDDQAETVVMRLARGSGVDGLGGMADRRPLKKSGEPVILERPLLGVSKSKLVSYLKAQHHPWLEDPSNASRDFERIRLRQAMPHLETLGVTRDALSLTATRARRARQALDHATSAFIDTYIALNNGAFADVSLYAFSTLPDEIQIRVLTRVLSAFGGAAPNAQLSQIEVLQARIVHGPRPQTVTLGGCVISVQDNQMQIYRELGRTPLPVMDLAPGAVLTWDRRFEIVVSPDEVNALPDLQVRPLDAASFTALKACLGPEFTGIAAAAAQTLPSLWREDQLVAIPTLNVGLAKMVEIRDQRAKRDVAQGCGPGTSKEPGVRGSEIGHEACSDPAEVVFIGLAEHRFGT